ncbi:MAG: acylneuraminate cytidylyltransferase family protein [Micavibrio sp.]|nr:acylneuraminate cytidylyltransferase family protein [Micavibrio sp.]
MYQNKKILAIVPARGGSKGIPLKNLRLINGVPMIGLVGDVIKDVASIDRAVVSTDHEEIAHFAQKHGIDAPFRRPKDLSGDRIGDLEVLTHALLATEKDDGQHYDIIVMLQPTSPLRRAEHVRDTIQKMIDGEYDAVWTISETDTKAHPYKQLIFDDGIMDYYDQQHADKIIARQQLSTLYHRNGVAYAISRKCLLEQKNIKGKKTGAVLINEPMVSIDTEFDIELVEFLLSRKGT